MKNKDSSVLLRSINKSEEVVTLGSRHKGDGVSNQEQFCLEEIKDLPVDTPQDISQHDMLRAQELADVKEKYRLEYVTKLEAEKLKLKRFNDQQLLVLENKYKEKINILNNCILEFDRNLKNLNSSIEKISIKVIDSILEKIVFSLLGNEELIINIVRKTILQHRLDQGFVMKVGLTDFEMIKKIIDESEVLKSYAIVVTEDRSLNVGQVVVELNATSIDIGLGQQIKKVRQLLND
ncbi:FliH/SctL family protein [Acinetobacter sp. 3657]|uniref:FliH/SctL family protein n=1 Tax=Acinetobacter sp. 3657 TaxID=2817764 RepID=UPI0028652F76|nr:hypothetical protein [Prolinoborus sp. 3657]